MIFRTINADAKKLTEQFGLLNKSFRDIKKDFANGLGVKNSLFQTSISKTDYQALQKFNSAIKVTNDGLTKSQRITKAWNENMTGCSIAAKRMGNDLVTGKKNIQDVSNAMNTASVSTKALGVAMNVMANVGFILAITAITKVISELAQAQEHAIQSAKEATETYKSELDSIADYKKRLSELHEELKSGNLSYEETKTKRTELMSIQDELIEKFGNEKGAIESVTEAINGQVDALDELNEKAYRDWIAKAGEQTFWNKLLPWGKSGLDQAIDYMETEKTVSFMDMQNANLSDELQAIQKEIDETIRTKYNLDKTFAMFNVTGTPDELRTQLENIRQDYIDISENIFKNHSINDKDLWKEYRKETIDSINEAINSLDKGLEKHQDTYRTYIEGLIKYDSEYSDEYANILQKRAELESAQNSGNEEDIKKAKQAFMAAINEGITASESDENIKKYFESLYPELQAEFSKWSFEFDLEANVKGLNDTAKEISEKYTATDLLGMLDDESAIIADSAFNSLIDKAIEYGICADKSAEEVQKLIDLLVELGVIQDNVKGDTFNDENHISISDTVDQLNTRLKPAMDSLRSAYQNIFTDSGFTLENVGVDMLYSIKEDIDTLNSMEGVNISIDASVFENFARVLNNTSSTADQVKTQFNELANTIVRASGSVAVNTDTFDILASSLEDMGFVNARSVLEEVITAQQAFQEVSEQLGLSLEEVTNATYEETVQMLLAAQASELDTQALWKLAVAQGTITDGTIATETNVDALLAEAKAAGLDAATLTALENVRNGNIKDTNAAQAIMEQAKQSIIASMSDFKLDYDFNPAIKSAGKAGSDTGKSYKEGLKEELSDLNSVISGITKSIDGQIDVIDEQKDTALDAIEAQIEALEEERDARLAVIDAQKAQLEAEIESIDKKIKSKQDEIDAINDAAEARNREIDLQKAQYNLERMQNQRTILQYSQEKGMHYVADEQGIRDAREDVDDARRQIEIADIEKEIDLLESQKDLLNEQIDLLDQQADKINEFYDAQIKTLEKQKEETEKYFESLTKALEDSKSKYTELTEIADKAELSAKLAQLGIDEAALLSGSEEEFQKLKSAYMDTVFQLNEGNTQVLSKLQELSGYSGTAPALLSDSNSALDTMNGKLDLSNQSVGTVNSSLGAAAAIAGEVASNVGALETNLGTVNTFLTDEQTAFSNLKATIDEVITALNLKIQAIQAAQSAAGIAVTTEIAYFLLLRDKIDEIKQSIAGINDAIIIIDRQPIDHLADSFQRLYEQILLVSTTLGSGMEGQGAGLAGNIISAMQALNKISFEEGIIAQLTNLKTAIDAVTNAISGGGDTSGGETQGGSGATTGGNPGGKDSGGTGNGKSLTGAITDIGTTTSEVIGEPDAEGDGTVIGAFGALETAVDDVTTAIGSGDSEDNEAKGADGEDDNSLIDSIIGLGDTTEDILGEPGGDGVIGRFEQFKEPIAAADEHVRSIYKGLTDIDGTEAECTIKVHIETDGSPNFTGAGQVLGSMNLESADYAATLNQNTTYDPNQDHSVFGKLYKAWNSHYGSNNQGVETIAKTLSRHLVIEHSQQMTKEITRISNSNNAANHGRDSRPPVTVQIGDIHLTGVQDVNGLAQAIKTRLPGQMMQEYFKN